MGYHSLLQGIFSTWGSNLGLLPCRQILYHLSHKRSLNWSEVSFFRFFIEFYFQKKFPFYFSFKGWKLAEVSFCGVQDCSWYGHHSPDLPTLQIFTECPMGDTIYSTHSLIFGILHQTGPISVLNFVCVWFKIHLPFSLLPSSLRGCPVWNPSVGSFAFSLGLASGGHQQGTEGLEQWWTLHIAALPRVWSSLLSFGPFVLLA